MSGKRVRVVRGGQDRWTCRTRSRPIGSTPAPTISYSARSSTPAGRRPFASPTRGRASASWRSASAPACRCRFSAAIPRSPGSTISSRQASSTSARRGRAIFLAIGDCCAASTPSRIGRNSGGVSGFRLRAALAAADEDLAARRPVISEEVILHPLCPTIGIVKVGPVALADAQRLGALLAREAGDQPVGADEVEAAERALAAQIGVARTQLPVRLLRGEDDLLRKQRRRGEAERETDEQGTEGEGSACHS